MNRMNNLKRMILSAAGISILFCGCGNNVERADNGESAIVESTTVSTEASEAESTSSDSTDAASEEIKELPSASQEESTEGTSEHEDVTSPQESDDGTSLSVKAVMEEMSLREKVCQMFIVTPEQLTGYGCVTYGDSVVQRSFMDIPVGGIILFAQNL